MGPFCMESLETPLIYTTRFSIVSCTSPSLLSRRIVTPGLLGMQLKGLKIRHGGVNMESLKLSRGEQVKGGIDTCESFK